jgi:hypothetical protein
MTRCVKMNNPQTFFLCFLWALKIAKNIHIKIFLYVAAECSGHWIFLCDMDFKSLVILWQGGTCLVSFSTESTTNFEDILWICIRYTRYVTVKMSFVYWPKLNSPTKLQSGFNLFIFYILRTKLRNGWSKLWNIFIYINYMNEDQSSF